MADQFVVAPVAAIEQVDIVFVQPVRRIAHQYVVEPLSESGDRRQRGELRYARELSLYGVGNLLDQEVAETDTGKPCLTVADRIEDRGIGLLLLLLVGRRVDQCMDFAGKPVGQGNLDKNQGFVRQGGVKKPEASAIIRQAPA